MIPRWLWWAPLVGLVALGALWALRLGRIAATLTESDVIAAQAADYAARTGRPVSDCRAFPGSSAGIWIVVVCEGDGMRTEYFVNRLGGVEDRVETGGATR